MAHYEGFKGPWGIWLGAFYASIEKEQEHDTGLVPGTRQLKFSQTLIELAVPYRFAWKPVAADVFLGARYNNIYTEIGIPSRDLKKDDNWAFVRPSSWVCGF